MGVIIIQRTLSKGAWTGRFSGVGTACADLFYATIVAFGLNLVIENIVTEHQLLIQIFGGILLIILGVYIFFRNPLEPVQHKHIKGVPQPKISKSGLVGDALSMFFLTLSNPIGIVIFVGAFGATNVLVGSNGEQLGTLLKVTILLGLFLGACSWWYILSSLINLFRKKFTMHTLITINRIAGIVLGVLGIVAILSAFDNVRHFFESASLISLNI